MNLHFDHPAVLLLGLIALPVVAVGWVNLVGLDRVRRVIVVGLRALLLAALAIMLAGPHTIQEHDQLTVIGLLDVSGSVRRFANLPATDELARHSNLEYLRRWFRQATQTKTPDDRFGLIVFDGQAIAIATPTKGEYVDDNIDMTMMEGTNIAQAIQLGLAMFPPDTAKRLVLVTDGNETSGDTYEAARRAAAAPGGQGVRIDVLPIAYRVSSDVQIARVETPPSAQPGQTVTVRIILESTAPTSGRLILRHEGTEVDLNGRRPGTSRRIEVPAGRSVHLAQVPLGETPVNRFEAIFEPDVTEADALADNNRAEAFTSTPSKGTVLVVDSRLPAQEGPNALAQTLEQAGIPVRAEPPDRFPTDLLSLQAYDLIILDNVAAVDLDRQQHELLSRYVNDLGGGLIMVGGENSFGAGGWNGSALEDVLPVELDPPKELRLPTAALVLVLDKSGSMNRPVAGTRSTQQEVANEAAALAVESLRADTLIGVVTFDIITHVRVPPRRNDDSRWIADRIRGITAGGGTNLGPALRQAHRMLASTDVAKKRVVCLTDGQSPTAGLDQIVKAMAADGIKLTTIAVGDEADRVTLERLAEIGGGTFYTVRNPRILPRVLVDSVQVINKPLVKEVPFVPVVHPTGSALTAGMDAAPPLGGLVVTAARPDPTVSVEMTHPDGEPLLAHWQAGLGRVAVFTSDAQGNWSNQWLD
ncbi:MAG: VWA domain-containing protein, partial [Planctomycetota bacterium]